ncbi:MAG TPA: hypothetical protein VLT33_12130 [Labilithrix sp.]|nr:hypothetical protein [Labilithrix sp.]
MRRAILVALPLALGVSLPASLARAEPPADAGAPRPPPKREMPPRPTIVVPAQAVARALEKRDVGATNALAPDGTPLGAKLVGVSKYGTGLKDGDIVTSVGGVPTPTVDALVGAGVRASIGGATQLSGKILRGATTYAVVLELPK